MIVAKRRRQKTVDSASTQLRRAASATGCCRGTGAGRRPTSSVLLHRRDRRSRSAVVSPDGRRTRTARGARRGLNVGKGGGHCRSTSFSGTKSWPSSRSLTVRERRDSTASRNRCRHRRRGRRGDNRRPQYSSPRRRASSRCTISASAAGQLRRPGTIEDVSARVLTAGMGSGLCSPGSCGTIRVKLSARQAADGGAVGPMMIRTTTRRRSACGIRRDGWRLRPTWLMGRSRGR